MFNEKDFIKKTNLRLELEREFNQKHCQHKYETKFSYQLDVPAQKRTPTTLNICVKCQKRDLGSIKYGISEYL